MSTMEPLDRDCPGRGAFASCRWASLPRPERMELMKADVPVSAQISATSSTPRPVPIPGD